MEEQPAHASGAHPAQDARREIFDPAELAEVLARYDLGHIHALRELPRGSKRAPKAVITSDRGAFVLKRRALGRDDERRVALCHAVQLHLGARGFPLARLVPARDAETIVHVGGRIYELFEFVRGAGFDGMPAAAHAAGRELAVLHTHTATFDPPWRPAGAGYHRIDRLAPLLDALPARMGAEGAGARPAADALRDSYQRAASAADDLGLPDWPTQVVHGDWHPGNMVFRAGAVAAVVDFDATRVEARVLDLANGALQFSITRKGDDPGEWPESLDEERFRRFCHGYDGVKGCTISVAEIRATPWLMIEALVVEAVAPIAATGSFARMEGGAFIRMVERKVHWLEHNAQRLVELIES